MNDHPKPPRIETLITNHSAAVHLLLGGKIRSARALIGVALFGVGLRYATSGVSYPGLTYLPPRTWGTILALMAMVVLATTWYRRWEIFGRTTAAVLAAILAVLAADTWDFSIGSAWVLIVMVVFLLLEAAGDAYYPVASG